MSLHKWHFTGYGPPIIFTKFSWAKFYNFFVCNSKIKIHRKIQHLFKLATSIKYKSFHQMLNIFVNLDFCIMKKLWDLAHEQLVSMIGGHCVEINIMAIRVLEFSNGYIKLERFSPKNQHTKRKFLNFENWTNRKPQ